MDASQNVPPVRKAVRMTHPDDPKVINLATGTFHCPNTPENRARFARMWERLLNWRKFVQKERPKKPAIIP